MEEKMHLYIREKETGRIITHFIYPIEEWKLIELACVAENIQPEEFFHRAITQFIDKHSKPL